MERFFAIAGLTFRVLTDGDADWTPTGVLAQFETAAAEAWDCTLEYRFCDRLPEPEGRPIYGDATKRVYVHGDVQLRYEGPVERDLEHAHLCIRRRGDQSLIHLRRSKTGEELTARVVLATMEAEHRIVERGGFLLHASWICREGRAILFTAPSGTGKSTQAELWRRLRGARVLNGDRAAVVLEPDGTAVVWGIPFAGTSGICENASLPLAAVVYLSQAKETVIRPLGGLRAFRSIWEGCSVNAWNPEDLDRCARTVTEVLSRVPVYHLACTPDVSAVEALERELEQWR